MIMGIPTKLPPCRKKVPQLSGIVTSGISQPVTEPLPRSGGEIYCSDRLQRPLLGNNVYDASGGIRPINRSTRPFNYLNLLNIVHSYNLVDINYRFRAGSIVRHRISHAIIHPAAVNQYNDSGISINGNNRMCLGISVFAAPIASGCLYLHAGNILQCVADLRIMPFLYRIRINNLHIPAGTIIRLFRNHISKPVFLPVCRNFNPIQRINSIYIHTACRKCQHCHHRIKLFTHTFSPLI